MANEEFVEKLIKERYCANDNERQGDIWNNICERVANYLGATDDEINVFHDIMYRKEFLPNSPTLMNAGTATPMLSACFYLPISDCISNGRDGIFDQVKNAALIFKYGGGVGLNFSKLRPAGSKVKSTQGVSSGVISFMKNFNTMTETIKQGGKRRGALMGCLDITHPEAKSFISCKTIEGDLSNFNISVKLTDEFMKSVENNSKEELELFNLIIEGIYKNGEPGILFKDEIEKHNPNKDIGELNPNPSLRKGTRILTSDGIYKIESLENKNFSVPTLINEKSQAICKLSGKNKQLYEIELTTNVKYYATKEHKWIVTNNNTIFKKTTDTLTAGDILPTSSNYNIMTYGTVGTYDEGFLIGWNIGDGGITKRSDTNIYQYNFTFGQSDVDNKIYSYVKSIINNICENDNINGCIRLNKHTGNKFIEINTTNIKIHELFKKYDIYNKSNGISDFIFENTTNEFRKGLIDGIFSADGCIINRMDDKIKYAWIELKIKHETLVNDLIDLLGFYGISAQKCEETSSNVPFPNKKNYNKDYHIFKLHINKHNLIKFRDIFTLTHIEKQNKLQSIQLLIKMPLKDTVRIKSVTITTLYEDVWDLTVDDSSHSFRISQCFTGNCAEALLLDFESCNLGSINWSKLYKDSKDPNSNSWYDYIDWDKYEQLIRNSTVFLNRVIEGNKYPLPEIDKATKLTRKIGLGGMGFHDLLLKLHIPYDSEQAVDIAKKLEITLKNIAYDESVKNNFKNSSLTTIAPTGTISIIADVSSGIEPVFNWVITRKDSLGEHYIIHPIFDDELKKICIPNYKTTRDITELDRLSSEKRYNEVIKHCHERGTIQDIEWLPEDFKKLFKNAMDINWKQHVKMQSVFQTNGVDMSISKTINLPNNATKSDIREAIFMAWRMKCKGITIYRSGSRELEVLNTKKEEPQKIQDLRITLNKQIDETIQPQTQKESSLKRPRHLYGTTYKVQSGCGKLYVTINERNGKPYEVFIQSGGSGGCEAGNQALGRTISLALRSGGDIQNIIKQLNKVKCPAALRNSRSEGKSCSDIVGHLLTESIPDFDDDDTDEVEYLKKTYDSNGDLVKDIIIPPSFLEDFLEECPDCHKKTLVRESGCKVCHSCGYNKCG